MLKRKRSHRHFKKDKSMYTQQLDVKNSSLFANFRVLKPTVGNIYTYNLIESMS